MPDVTMPKMGFDMQEGTIVRWLRQIGDEVRRGEPIAEIETDKVTIEIEAFDSGVLREIVVAAGQTVPVNAVIARLGDDAPSPPAAPAAAAVEQPSSPPAAPSVPAVAVAPPAVDDREVRASPLARRIARDHGLPLAGIAGTGPLGRVVRADVEQALTARPAAAPSAVAAPTPAVVAAPTPAVVAAPTPAVVAAPTPAVAAPTPVAASPRGDVVPLTSMRRTIARVTSQSWQQAPHFMLTMEVDMGACLALRGSINAGRPREAQIGVNDMIVKAAARALRGFPMLNASYSDAGIELHHDVNVSIAVALDAGLVAPVITGCQSRSLGAISRESKRLVALAREGKLGAADLQGGTFTVSNLGMYGVSEFVAIITVPQAAILAVGAVRRVPAFRDDSDEVIARQVMNLTLSADHRITDGAEAARFLGEVRRSLEQPLELLVD